MGLDDYFDRKKIEVFTIKPEIKAMTRKERLELLNRLFMEEYQGKFVTYEMLERDLFVETNGRTRKHFGHKGPGTTHKEHLAKINICASGGYWDMIADASYYGSKPENKSDQNHFHKNTVAWHYFTKDIMCEDHYFRVVIDVNENKDHEFLIYSVELHSLGKEYALRMEKLAEKKEKEAQESRLSVDSGEWQVASEGVDELTNSSTESNGTKKEKELISPGRDDTGLCDELFTRGIIAEKHLEVNSHEKQSLEDLINAARNGSKNELSGTNEHSLRGYGARGLRE